MKSDVTLSSGGLCIWPSCSALTAVCSAFRTFAEGAAGERLFDNRTWGCAVAPEGIPGLLSRGVSLRACWHFSELPQAPSWALTSPEIHRPVPGIRALGLPMSSVPEHAGLSSNDAKSSEIILSTEMPPSQGGPEHERAVHSGGYSGEDRHILPSSGQLHLQSNLITQVMSPIPSGINTAPCHFSMNTGVCVSVCVQVCVLWSDTWISLLKFCSWSLVLLEKDWIWGEHEQHMTNRGKLLLGPQTLTFYKALKSL